MKHGGKKQEAKNLSQPAKHPISVSDELSLIQEKGNQDRQSISARHEPHETDSLWRDSLESYQRRLDNPRFIPGARVEYPDAPDLLRQEFIGPLMKGSAAGGGFPKPAQNRLISHAGNAWMVNPETGEATQVIKSPPKVEAKKMNLLQKRMFDDLSDQIKSTRKAVEVKGDSIDSDSGLPSNFELKNSLVGLEKKRNKILSDFMQSSNKPDDAPGDLLSQPKAAINPVAVAPTSPARRGWGYIGTGEGENLYSDKTGMTDAPVVAPGFDWSNPRGAQAMTGQTSAPSDLLRGDANDPTERGFRLDGAISSNAIPQDAPMADFKDSPKIPESHIKHLLANPDTVDFFEEKYGKGSADPYLEADRQP